MQILVNNDNEIVGYATIGGFEDGINIENDNIPQGFMQNYKPKHYLYQNEQIVVNPDYDEEPNVSYEPTITTASGSDESLRRMFASLQVQLVQANTIVAQMTQQNAKLSQEVVELKDEIESMKGENKDEDAVSEV